MNNWHEGHPDIGRVVWVLGAYSVPVGHLLLAVWDGHNWHALNGELLLGVTYWQEQ